jgi:hypothetical protein
MRCLGAGTLLDASGGEGILAGLEYDLPCAEKLYVNMGCNIVSRR